ncbi:ABC-three component system middle component 1 [Sulfurovum sp. NBC37-1]|uniref:ABC-three component system middle component 1 n=1 Tax=Sulfurovum sp. (strain NBC37-1) TaxID=387093 RepID=UPI0001587867|nr:ABC-three component system middle component 1 [Sulfurovum sp. NBC37-1]BAF71690.1 conserved hypothetical protein [Sulfurovum sp. NBC37-1]
MKLIKFLDNKDIEEIKLNYDLNYLKVVKYESYDLIVIFIKEKSSNKLKENWQKTCSVLSESIEDELLIDNFIRWNVYILYTLEEEVSNELKYKIENNTFFARKIIEDRYKLDLTDENIQKLIEKHITFNDIRLIKTSQVNDKYSSDSKVYSELKDLHDINANKIDEILNLLEEGVK